MLTNGYFALFFLYGFLVSITVASIGPHPRSKTKEEERKRYDNYKVYKVKIENTKQYEKILALENEVQLDFWNEIHNYNETFDVMISPAQQQKFENFLQEAKIVHSIKIENVQSLINTEKQSIGRSSTGMDWQDFHTLDEIYQWLDAVAKRYPTIVTPFDIGYSYEGRIIKGLKISFKPGNKAVFIESNIHAREWITSATII